MQKQKEKEVRKRKEEIEKREVEERKRQEEKEKRKRKKIQEVINFILFCTPTEINRRMMSMCLWVPILILPCTSTLNYLRLLPGPLLHTLTVLLSLHLLSLLLH